MPKQQFPRVGDLALVRGQRWRIVDVRPYPACKVVSLTGAGATNAGHAARVITPFDRVEVAASAPRIRLVGVRRWRHRCRALLASHGPADRLQSALHARIELLPHQLEPVLAIVRGLACRILIADEVGLGKTIQAGLIVAEVKARQAADRVLVLTPAGLREQWAHELRHRFELDPEIMDKWSVRKRSALLPVGVNPWATVALAIASYDYVKQPDVEPALAACRWDLVVVDEAHNVTAGSDRRAAVDALCRRASYVVLLSATPHSGSAAAFKSLCAIGAPPDDRLYIFRRSRAQVALSADRRVHLSHVRPTDAERDMHATLMEVAGAAAGDDRRLAETSQAMEQTIETPHLRLSQ